MRWSISAESPGDIETQRQLLAKDKELFQKDKDIQDLKTKLTEVQSKDSKNSVYSEYEKILKSGKINGFIDKKDLLLSSSDINKQSLSNVAEATAFGFIKNNRNNDDYSTLTEKGVDFFKWLLMVDNTEI